MKVRRTWRRLPNSRSPGRAPARLPIGADPKRRRVITRTTTVVTTTWTVRWADGDQENAKEKPPDRIE